MIQMFNQPWLIFCVVSFASLGFVLRRFVLHCLALPNIMSRWHELLRIELVSFVPSPWMSRLASRTLPLPHSRCSFCLALPWLLGCVMLPCAALHRIGWPRAACLALWKCSLANPDSLSAASMFHFTNWRLAYTRHCFLIIRLPFH